MTYASHARDITGTITVVNQDVNAAPIRIPVRGQNRGVCGQVFLSFRSPIPFLPPLCSRPIFCASECEKLICAARISFTSYGNACYAGYHRCDFADRKINQALIFSADVVDFKFFVKVFRRKRME